MQATSGEDFPAAHSMDTSWFGVDDAGEIAYLESGEPGVMPLNAESHHWSELFSQCPLDQKICGVYRLTAGRWLRFVIRPSLLQTLPRLERTNLPRKLPCCLRTRRLLLPMFLAIASALWGRMSLSFLAIITALLGRITLFFIQSRYLLPG